MKLKIIICILITSFNLTDSFADKLPPMSEGTSNGIILYTKGDNKKILVLDFQKTIASWGHMCSCHIGFGCFTTSGKTELFYMLGDENTFTIRFNNKSTTDYVSPFQLDNSYYTHDKIYDGNNVCHILHIIKRIKMTNGRDDKDFLYIEPKSVIVYYFQNDYDKNFK